MSRRWAPAGATAGWPGAVACWARKATAGARHLSDGSESFPERASSCAGVSGGLGTGSVTITVLGNSERSGFATALAIADHIYVMGKGRMVFDGPPAELERRRDVQERYIGVGV